MKPFINPKKLPNTRIGWHRHFATKFNKNENPRTEQMSLWYLFLHLAFDVPEPVKDALDEQDFYEVCQAYRHADTLDAAKQFEALKARIREEIAVKEKTSA